MKQININLLGDAAPSLSLPGELNIDPALVITGVVGLLSAFIVPNVLAVLIDNFLINPTSTRIEQIKTSIGANKGKATRLAQIQKQLQSLEGDYNTLLTLAKESSTWKSVLEEVRDVTPTDMWLTELRIEGSSKIKLSGVAINYQAIAFFYTNLQNGASFRHPILGGLQTESNAGQTLIRFNVDCDLKPGAGV